MTGQEFRDYIVNSAFKRTDKDTQIYEAITDVIIQMKKKFNSEDFKEEAFVTSISSIGDYKLSVPQDFGHIIGDMTGKDNPDDHWVIRKITKETYDILYSDRNLSPVSNIHTDRPRHFCLYGNQLFLGPVPDSTDYEYQINYTTEAATAITSSTTSVPFTNKERRTLKYGVLAQLYYDLGLDNEGLKWTALFTQDLNDLIENDDTNSDAKEQVIYHGI